MALVSYTALLVGWLVVFALLLFVLLFGEAEMFEGTFVERLHWILTDGVPYGVSRVLRKFIGDARAEKIEALAQEVLCERPNPAMQLIYVALVMGGYWVYCVHVEPLIFAGAISASHAVVVPVAMFISIASWLAVCFSDPGVVDAHTLDAQLATYPHDHVLYKPKTCPTLGVTCPARSKYCRVTQRRVAKFDHYCGWMGNSIGENNLRYFVTFLAVHVVLTSYGSWLCASAISGEIGRRLWSASSSRLPKTRRRRERRRLAFGFGLELVHEIRRVPLLARGDAFTVPRDPRGDAGCVPGVPPVVDSQGSDHERELQVGGLRALFATNGGGAGAGGVEQPVHRVGRKRRNRDVRG